MKRSGERKLRAMIKWLCLAGLVVVLDQWSKHLADRLLELHQPVPIMPFLNFTLTFNPGAAFSFLSDADGWQRWFFSGLSILISIFIVAWLRSVARNQVWMPCALALVLGGALGNLWDRLTLGAVVDFIDVYYATWHWPAFNIADSAICVGAIMLLVSSFRDRENKVDPSA